MKFLLSLLVCVVVLVHAESVCDFPADLQGSWSGDDEKEIDITTDELVGFKLTIPHLSQSDFDCIRSFEEGISTKYLLRAREKVTVFGITPTMYMCFEIEKQNSETKYAIDTKRDKFLQENVYATMYTDTPSKEAICNAQNQEKIIIRKIQDQARQNIKKSSQLERLVSRLRQELSENESDDVDN